MTENMCQNIRSCSETEAECTAKFGTPDAAFDGSLERDDCHLDVASNRHRWPTVTRRCFFCGFRELLSGFSWSFRACAGGRGTSLSRVTHGGK